LGAGEGGLVSARAPTYDRDALFPLELIGHTAIVLRRASPRQTGCILSLPGASWNERMRE
jgi:hypothetical protein